MSESTQIKPELCQIASNSDFVENEVQIETNGDLSADHNDSQTDVPLIKANVDNCIESSTKTMSFSAEDRSETESEPKFGTNGTTGMTRVTQLNGVNGMRNINTNGSTQAPDVCSGSQHIADTADSGDGVDGMREQRSQDYLTAHISSASISALPETNNENEVIIIETVVRTDSNEVTLITDTTLKTTSHSSDQSLNQSSSDSSSESTPNSASNHNNNNNTKVNNNFENNIKNNSKAMTTTTTTTTTSRPIKQLKSLLKKGSKENQMKRQSEQRKRVTFSETMQVFCDDWPQNLMPQIIALKSPTDFNLVEVQGYMFEPPVGFQDFLPFEPPPDYRDYLYANSLCTFDNDLSINYIDEEEDMDESSSGTNSENPNKEQLMNEWEAKWESMILNQNESLEEEQIIGVLKEDAILQAIGSHISLPEEQLCPEDFPIHFPNQDSSGAKLAESELSDITSDDGNDSSPTGSLQDMHSDSSITSQDTIILINADNESTQVFSNKKFFSESQTSNEGMNSSMDSECEANCRTESDDKSAKTDSLDNSLVNESNREINSSLESEDSTETSTECDSTLKESTEGEEEEEVDSAPDVTLDSNVSKEVETNETHETDCKPTKRSECELNNSSDEMNDRKRFDLFVNDSTDSLRSHHSNSFRRNLMFYENMFTDSNNKSDNCSQQSDRPAKQNSQPIVSHTVSQFVLENKLKFPTITQTISNNNNNENSAKQQTNETSVEVKQLSNEVNTNPMNNNNNNKCQSLQSSSMQTRAPAQQQSHQQTQQTQPKASNWSPDEFIIEYTSEPRALVPSKRTASLSNFATALSTPNQPMIAIRSNANNNNIQYLSLNRNGTEPKQWNAYNIDLHNNSQQIRYPVPPMQRSLSPNPPMSSANTRPISPQQVFYQSRPQYTPRYSSTQAMPVQVMYSRTLPKNQSIRLPVMTQTLGPVQHKQPPPYHYHIQQQSNPEFPNPSEIRRRDGLNAYPHVLNQTPQAGTLPVPPVHHNNQNNSMPTLSKDELEQFVQQDIQRTERIKKRYSMSEEDDPSFGFARRPSVRGIRPKFGTTNDILKQMQTQSNGSIGTQLNGNHVSWPQTSATNSTQNAKQNNNKNSNNPMPVQHNQSFHNNPQMVRMRSGTQSVMSVKYVTDMSAPDSLQSSHPSQAQHSAHPTHTSTAGPQMSRTLPRPSSLISPSQMNAMRNESNGFVNRMAATASRDQLKQQIQSQRQCEQQMQPKLRPKTIIMSLSAKPVMSSNCDERGAPEGASSSPKHSSDLLFAKNLSTNSNTNTKANETTVSNKTSTNNKLQTNDTKKLVINEENNTNGDNEGVIYYSMNV